MTMSDDAKKFSAITYIKFNPAIVSVLKNQEVYLENGMEDNPCLLWILNVL